MKKYFVLLTVVLSFCLVQTAAANLVNNGGFETGTLTGSWTPGGLSVGVGVISSDSVYYPAHSGSKSAYFSGVDGLSSISQDLITTPGVSYDLSYYLRSYEYLTPNNFFSVAWGGTVIAGLTQTNVGGFGYTLFQTTQVATAASTTLTFIGKNVPAWFDLDDVSVVQSAVPLPGAIVLLGSGLLPLLGWRRFRKS